MEGLELYRKVDEGIGSKGYLDGPLDAGTNLKVKIMTRTIDVK